MAKDFATATAFKSALEAHLRKVAGERGLPFSTLQTKLVMERLLARLFSQTPAPWILKGGFALDLRFRPKARVTKDLDLSMAIVTPDGDSADYQILRERIQDAADRDLADRFSFRIGQPTKEFTNAPKGGARFLCEGILVGRVYARFHIDVGIGDAIIGAPELLTGDDLLSFASIPAATAAAIPLAQQFTEKLHAYTFPWERRVNTRTKDLVDLVLLIERGNLQLTELREALQITFATRATHRIPSALPPPPTAWAPEFSRLAEEAGLTTTTCDEAFSALTRFWDENGLSAS